VPAVSRRSQYGPAAGTKGGAAIKLSLLNPPEVLVTRRDELMALRRLSDYAVRGLYDALCELSDFETGEVFRDACYQELMAFGTPPRPERGRPRRGPTYDEMRRMLADLESVGLVKRSSAFNEAQGRLLMVLPFRAAAAQEWKQRRAQAIKPQGKAQGTKQREPA
jgi:hypothetical protein